MVYSVYQGTVYLNVIMCYCRVYVCVCNKKHPDVAIGEFLLTVTNIDLLLDSSVARM